MYVLCVPCYNKVTLDLLIIYFSPLPVWSSTLERQAGAFVMRRRAMAGITERKKSLKINKAIGMDMAGSGVRKTKGKPKLPVN